MKITNAAAEAFTAMRRRNLTQAGAQVAGGAAGVDKTAFLGLSETDMTAPVQMALKTLLGEIDDLRGEVTRLKGRLAEVEEQADRDPLTPLFNRRAFLRELHRAGTFAHRYGAAASLIYMDLDGFKSVNDRFGHPAGDAALKEVAARLTANVRDSDIVARLGGDEFAVILVQADLPTAQAKAQALRAAIEGRPIFFGEWSAPLKVSYGVIQITPDMDPEAALAAADAAMFTAKRARAAG